MIITPSKKSSQIDVFAHFLLGKSQLDENDF